MSFLRKNWEIGKFWEKSRKSYLRILQSLKQTFWSSFPKKNYFLTKLEEIYQFYHFKRFGPEYLRALAVRFEVEVLGTSYFHRMYLMMKLKVKILGLFAALLVSVLVSSTYGCANLHPPNRVKD